jgi:hypothetical protein
VSSINFDSSAYIAISGIKDNEGAVITRNYNSVKNIRQLNKGILILIIF